MKAKVEINDYYPFGLTFNSYQRSFSKKNNWLFQGQEHDETTGWDQFKWRNHQPDIGRFFNIDPLAEDYYYNSPYAFSENKVVAHVELEGLESIRTNDLIRFGIQATNPNVSKADLDKVMESYNKGFVKGSMGAATYTDANDFAVLGSLLTGNPRNIDNSTATSWDIGFAAGGALIPFASGSGLRRAGSEILNYFYKGAKGSDEVWTGSAELVDGVLELDFNVPSSLRNQGMGTAMFDDALQSFGDGIQGVKGLWKDGDNLKAFNQAIQDGANPTEAAFRTATGKWAQKNGFTKIEWGQSQTSKDGSVDYIQLIFRKE